MNDIELDLISENKKLKSELEQYKTNGAVGLYYELNRFVNNTVTLMRNNTLDSLIKTTKDDDAKKFEKMMSLIKNAKEHLTDMKDIKDKYGLSDNEGLDLLKKPFVDTIAQPRN